MRFKSLYAENLYSFATLSLNFLDYSGGTTIILGKNLDQKTANGAGKTSILKSLYFGLWGEDLDGATLKDIQNRNSQDGILVKIEFEDRGHEYTIIRYKDYKNNKNLHKNHEGESLTGTGIEFLIDGEAFMGDTSTATQKIIEQKLRMTPRLFLSSVLMSQNPKSLFLTAKDTEKKDLLTELLDLKPYARAFENIKKAIKENEDKAVLIETKIETSLTHVESTEAQIKELIVQRDSYADTTNLKITELQGEKAKLEAEVAVLRPQTQVKDEGEEIKRAIAQVEIKILKNKKELEAEVPTQKNLTLVINEILNAKVKVEEYQELEITLNKNISDLDSSISSLETVSFNEGELEKFRQEQSSLSIKIEALSKDLTQESELLVLIEKTQNSLKQKNKELSDIDHSIKESKENALCSQCLRKFNIGEDSSLDEMIKKLEVAKEKINQDIDFLVKKETQLSGEKEKYTLIKQDLKSLKEELSIIALRVEESQTAKQKFELHKQKRDMLQSEKNRLSEDLLKVAPLREDSLKKISLNEKRQSALEKLIEDLEVIKANTAKLEESIRSEKEKLISLEVISRSLNQIKQQITDKTDRIENINKEIKDLRTKANPYGKMLENHEANLKSIKTRIDNDRKNIATLQDELKYLNFWKFGFAPTGIRSFITDDVIDLLNRKTQENLNDMYDGALMISFDPESKNKKGEISNKISTEFFLNGEATPFESLSGGEKQRGVLAVELALTEIAEARSGTKLNLRFLDEPFTGIDDNGQGKALSLFAKLSRDKDGFFVISHDEKFQNMCQKQLYVVKSKKISRIVDRAEFDRTDIFNDAVDFHGYPEEGENLELLRKPKKFDINKALDKKRKNLEDED